MRAISKSFLTALIVLIAVNSYSQQLDGYVLAFEDEFNFLDGSKWWAKLPWGTRYMHCSDESPFYDKAYYDPDNVYVQDGNLIIKVDKPDDPFYALIDSTKDPLCALECKNNDITNRGLFTYSGGMLASKQNFRHGVYEIKFKFPDNGKGFWPGFWLFGSYNTGCPNDCEDRYEEIDIFEAETYDEDNPGHSIRVYWSRHYDNDNNGGRNTLSEDEHYGNTYNNDWHTYQLTWKTIGSYEYIEWVDSTDPNDIKSLWDQEIPTNLFAHNATMMVDMDLYDIENANPNNYTTFPGYLQVDYIRVWEPVQCSQTLMLCGLSHDEYGETAYAADIVEFTQNICSEPNIITKALWFDEPEPCGHICSRHLDVFACDYIDILPEFEAVYGSEFTATISADACCSEERLNPDSKFDDKADSLSNLNQDSLSKKLIVKIAPNPTLEQFNIHLAGSITSYLEITAFDAKGTLVYRTVLPEVSNDLSIDVSEWSTGSYLFVFRTADDEFHTHVVVQ